MSLLPIIMYNLPVIDLDSITRYIETEFEAKTKFKLYNKYNILEKLGNFTDQDELYNMTANLIQNNYICEIPFDILKNSFKLSLIFQQDNIQILYKNNRIDIDNIEKIKEEFMIISSDISEIPQVYVDTIILIINKFINKDLSVKYICKNIPKPYYNLFLLKINKSLNPISDDNIKYYKNIKYGLEYQSNSTCEIENGVEETKDDFQELESTDNSVLYSQSEMMTEIFNYIDDHNNDEFDLFLNCVHNLNEYDHTPNKNNISCIRYYVGHINHYINFFPNVVIKFYFVNKLYEMLIASKKIKKSNFSSKIIEILLEKKQYFDTLKGSNLKLEHNITIIYKNLEN